MGAPYWEGDERGMNACLGGFTAQFLFIHRGIPLKEVPSYISETQAWSEGELLAQQLCEKHDLSIIARIGYVVGMSASMLAARGVKLSPERDARSFGLGWFYLDATDAKNDEQCAWHWSMRRLFLKNWQRGRQGHAYHSPGEGKKV